MTTWLCGGDDVPDLPLSNYEASHPEQLWDWLESAAGGPDNAVAITHNANYSNGQMYNPRYSDGREIDEAYARRRALWEPLAEMFQSKGSSETTPAVSPHDPFAGFEIVASQAFQQISGASAGADGQMRWATVRGGLAEGLRQQERIGVNPFPIGFVSGNDGHSGTPGNSEAENWTGGNANIDDTADLRLYGEVEGGIPSVLLNPAGLTGVWADREHPRRPVRRAAAPRDVRHQRGAPDAPAVRRLGPRRGRRRATWPPPDTARACRWAPSCPPGQPGPPGRRSWPTRPRTRWAPTWTASRSSSAGPTRGMLFEKVYDVAASGGRTPGPHGALPPVGNTVNVSAATYTNDIGAAELSAAWTDPDFDPSLACVYYARILEIPTPRWSTYDAVRHGKPIPDNAPASVQQRAWTSPVWYTPSENDRAGRPAAEGMYTVAQLADRGIRPMTDEEIRAVTVGRTVRSVNLITGFEATLHYGADGNRSLMGLGDRPVVTPYEIRDGRRIETTLLGERMSVALFSVDGRTLAARDDEAGYINYEAFTTS